MESAVTEVAPDFETPFSRWGRYNVNYLDIEVEAPPAPPSSSSSSALSANKRTRKRHISENSFGPSGRRASVTGGPGNRTRHRVGRRKSDGHLSPMVLANTNHPAEENNQLLRPLEPCLRLSVIRREMSERKKRVVFADAPAILIPLPALPAPLPSSRMMRDVSSGSGGKNNGIRGEDGEEEILTPKERRRRKVVMAVVCTTFILLTASALFVLITLFNASAIDEAGIYNSNFLVFIGPL